MGKPLLACDPHLGKSVMSTWYVTRLSWKNHTNTNEINKVHLTGASVVGTPMFSHGRTPHMAWGVTALNPDSTDMFVEYTRMDTYLSKDTHAWEEI
jgi:penicillin amidase